MSYQRVDFPLSKDPLQGGMIGEIDIFLEKCLIEGEIIGIENGETDYTSTNMSTDILRTLDSSRHNNIQIVDSLSSNSQYTLVIDEREKRASFLFNYRDNSIYMIKEGELPFRVAANKYHKSLKLEDTIQESLTSDSTVSFEKFVDKQLNRGSMVLLLNDIKKTSYGVYKTLIEHFDTIKGCDRNLKPVYS